MLPTDASAWWDASWKLRRKIRFDNAGQSALSGFPVLVRLDSTRVEYFRTQDLGQDIRFVDADDSTVLAHEIESWNEAGSSYVWVRVPQVDGGSTTDFIYLYYDNAIAPDTQNPTGVWDAGHRGVWHLKEDPGGAPPQMKDSTVNANHGTSQGAMTTGDQVAGRIGGSLDLDGVDDYVAVPDAGSLDLPSSFTIEAWARWATVVSNGYIVEKGDSGPFANNYYLWWNDNTSVTPNTSVVSGFSTGSAFRDVIYDWTPAVGQWYHLVTVFDDAADELRFYVDGVQVATRATPSTPGADAGELRFGRDSKGVWSGDVWWDGGIDEVRVESVARSADWIRAQWLSMSDAFATFEPVACASGCQGLTATEAGGLVTVTSANAFELVFANGAGGHLREFYDLEESPLRDAVHDLAGGIASQLGLFFDEVSWPGPVPAAGNYRSDRSPAASRALVVPIEVTPTRVLVRSVSAFTSTSSAVLPHLEAIGDWTVYPAGRVALHWRRVSTSDVPINSEQLHLNVHYQSSGALSTWAGFNRSGPIAAGGNAAVPPNLQDFLMLQNEQAGARTDFLQVVHSDWPRISQMDAALNAPGEWFENTWHDLVAHTIPADSTESFSYLTWFKPTVFTGHTDPAVISRSDAYRTPDDLASPTPPAAGGGWFDAAESTSSPSDFFNEKEAAYTLDLDPAAGLVFDMDGASVTRHQPFFKIRQWRSLGPPTTIGVEGVSLARDAGFKADLMPLSRGGLHHDLLWHSTLEDANAVTSPDVGSAGSLTGSPTFEAARFGQGARLGASGDSIRVPTSGNFTAAKGAVSFWLRPTWGNADGVWHDICGFVVDASNLFVLEKRTDDNLYFRIVAGGTTSELQVASTDYSWQPGEWVHLQLEWDDSLGLSNQQRLYFGDKEPTHVDPASDYDSSALSVGATFRFGNTEGDATFAPGLYDEIEIISDVILLSRGGLLSSALEYFSDPTRNQPLDLSPVDADERGRYLFFGATARFRGLNVGLAVPGAGVPAGALLWEYWDGVAWSSLNAIPGFTDDTSSLTRSGAVHWPSDPPGWVPYSTFGGVEIYRVRAHLPAGFAYTTFPTEGLIKTDVLLLQYCGDVTADAQTFSIPPPLPTAVTLMGFSARPLDRAVELRWQTGSELDNLGFHLYRGPSAEGPWTRLNSSLVPGLGSSPHGQSYSWLDLGLTNGVRYFYRLEDVDTSSRSAFHGPVSTVPSPSAEGGGDDRGGDGTERGEGEAVESEPGSTSCPSWILAAVPDLVSPTCTRHGDPESVSLEILSRDATTATLELHTGGFYAVHERAGQVRVFVPGSDTPSDPSAPALPLRRALVDAVVGRQVHLVSAEAFDLRAFPGLVPSAVGRPEMLVSRDGTVRPARRTLAALHPSRGDWPPRPARLAGTAFQGEKKSAVVEIFPVRLDGARQQLVLAGRVRVEIAFTGREDGETGGGSVGRVVPRRKAAFPDVLAHLHTVRRGLHAVSFETLFPDRLRGFSTALLRLQRQGEAVPYRVEPASAVFGPGSRLYFLADRTSSSTDYSGEVAYELVRSAHGSTMGRVGAGPEGAPPVSSSTGFVSLETNRIYQPGLLDAPDVWLWEAMVGGATPRVVTFALPGVAAGSAGDARLVVRLQGASESGLATDHHLRVSVNGTFLGEASFAGKRPHIVELSVPSSLLRQGANELSLANAGDTGVPSLVFLDRFDVSYPQTPAARGGVFEGVWAEGGAAVVSGLSGSPLVLDTTEGAAVKWLVGLETTGSSVRFRAEGGHRYLVVSPEGLLSPRVETPAPSTLRDTRNQADYLLIAPEGFLDAARPLLERRASEGLAAHAVSLEEIAIVFGYGQPSAEAVREFLAFAFHSWTKPSPRFVLLLGDSSDDPQRFLASSLPSPLPAPRTKTSYLWTAVDPLLAAVNGEDALPDLAIGRLPATTTEEAQRLVHKLLDWEDSGQGLDGPVALVADNPDPGGDFEADVDDIHRSFLQGRQVHTLRLRELGPGTRPAILDAFNSGLALVSYAGHGGPAVWASENVWNSWDVPALLPQSRQPLLLTFNCLNGYFLAPSYDALAEALLKAEGRGALAAFSPSGLSLDGPAHLYHRALVAEITSGRHERLGDAVLAAQKTYAESGLMPELLAVYHLLGDPATRIQPAP